MSAKRWFQAFPLELELHPEGTLPHVDLESLRDSLERNFPRSRTVIRPDPLRVPDLPAAEGNRPTLENLAEEIAAVRIIHPTRVPEPHAPLPGEVAVERERLIDPSRTAFGVLYDGLELQRILADRLTPDGPSPGVCRIVLTNRLIGSWDRGDRRVHARVAVFGFPSLISVPGIIAAPARPREHYLPQRLGLPTLPGGENENGEVLRPGDPRLTEVLKGYVLQAVFYHGTGDPFCEDPDCRLFNAHRQAEVIRAQLGEGAELCPRHRQILRTHQNPKGG
ncbi:MAG: DUF6775 family putative metallopeptidase [Planctomycetota bacterium]